MEVLKVILTSLLSVCALFAVAKIMGHKQLAQFDFFDYINGITIGSIGAELATELEAPWKPLIAIAIFGACSVIFSTVTNKSARSRKYINGTPCILLDNGKLYRDNLKRSKLDLSEFMVMCRERGYFDLRDIRTALLETNGQLSILPVGMKRPVTPQDMNLCVADEQIGCEIIMDGRIMGENLKRLGFDTVWLEKHLKNQGFKSEKEVFLGICHGPDDVVFYGVDN